jgi:hypothetical protein
LDALRKRLEDAAASAAQQDRIQAAVPVRKKGLLAHSDESGRARSAFQAGQAELEAREATVGAEAACASPADAAGEVQQTLRASGCCCRGISAFCRGFVGSSNDFRYHENKDGASRTPGIDDQRKLLHLLSGGWAHLRILLHKTFVYNVKGHVTPK